MTVDKYDHSKTFQTFSIEMRQMRLFYNFYSLQLFNAKVILFTTGKTCIYYVFYLRFYSETAVIFQVWFYRSINISTAL